MHAVIVERKWKDKERVIGECSHPETRLFKSSVMDNPKVVAPQEDTTQMKKMFAMDLKVPL